MSLVPWKPPLEMPDEGTPPAKGAGFFASLKHLVKAFRLTVAGWILMFIGFALVPLIIKVMAGLGIGFVTYQLGSFALDQLFAKVQEYVTQLPPEALVFASMCNIDEAISIVFSGLAVRLSFLGFNALNSSGKAKQMIWQA